MGLVKEESLLTTIMLLISAGIVLLMESAKIRPIPWGSVELSLILIGVGIVLAFVRGHLKINHSSG